jgi:hypothetical protein
MWTIIAKKCLDVPLLLLNDRAHKVRIFRFIKSSTDPLSFQQMVKLYEFVNRAK